MIEMQWWAIPAGMEFTLALVCALVANVDEIGAEMAGAALFMVGSMLCSALALAFYLMSL
jgi:hypothetical protein